MSGINWSLPDDDVRPVLESDDDEPDTEGAAYRGGYASGFEAGRRAAFDAFAARCIKGGPSWTPTLCDLARFLIEESGGEPHMDAVNAKSRELGWKR